MTPDIIPTLCLMFAGLFVVGVLACLPLYDYSFKKLRQSKLWIKIVWWIPIFAGFVALLYLGHIAAYITACGLVVMGFFEYRRNEGVRSAIASIYLLVYSASIAHLPFLWDVLSLNTTVMMLVVICFSSVLSDVCAFFLGNYKGNHPLPAWINSRKSWEGVFGQVCGALIGFGIVSMAFGIPYNIALALTIGAASALGDLINSIAKRSLKITDWAQTIPGHGGILDRFSSLSVAISAAYWFLRLS